VHGVDEQVDIAELSILDFHEAVGQWTVECRVLHFDLSGAIESWDNLKC